jgi:hypothetical protein
LKVWAKGLVDISLEYCRCISESKGYDQGFQEAIVGVYDCLSEIIILYLNKAINITNINFGEVLFLESPGQHFCDHWQRISVLYSSLIEFPVIDAWF